MKKLVILAGIVVGLIGLGIWYYSDEKIVERKSHEFVASFEKEESDGLLTGVLSESDFRDLLDKKVALNFEQRDMPDMPTGIKHTREHLARNYLYLMKTAKLIKITNTKVEILNIEDDTAKVKIEAHGEVKHKIYSKNSDITIILHFNKTDEGWRISSITLKR